MLQLVIQTCHRRGVHAIGGMSALIPVKGNPAANEVRKLVLNGCYCFRSMSSCASLVPATVRSGRGHTAVQGGLSTNFTHVATHGHAVQAAFEKVRADKLREVQDGHDGTWVAHPGLIAVAKEVRLFDLRAMRVLWVKCEGWQWRWNFSRTPEASPAGCLLCTLDRCCRWKAAGV